MLCLCVLLPGVANAAEVLELALSTLTVEIKYEGTPLPDLKIAVCRVAAAMQDGGSITFESTAAFAAANADYSNLTAEKNVALAADLDAYAIANSIPRSSGITNNSGRVSFANLSVGLYLVAQLDGEDSEYLIDPYLVLVPSTRDGRSWDYNVLSHPKTEPTKRDGEFVSVSVQKVWGSCEHPASVQVQLYRNGVAYGSPVTLNDGNDWSHTWPDLPAEDTWTVDEPNVPTGFTKSISGSVIGGFVIINIPTCTTPPTCPPTCPPTPGPSCSPAPTRKPGGGGGKSDNPKTSDEAKALYYIFGICAAGAVSVVLISRLKRKRRREE